MGSRTYQRILECAECGRVPGHGEPMWEMGNVYWCDDCCNKDEEEEIEHSRHRLGPFVEDDDTSNLMGG